MARTRQKSVRLIGWREWVGLPDLGIATVKAKVDTGASTSSLHAIDIQPFDKDGEPHVRFLVHPVQRRRRPEIICVAAVHDHRPVTSSSGHKEERYVIRTRASVGPLTWPIEITLTDRDAMGFRMLLGREALRRRFMVDSGHSFVAGAQRITVDPPKPERRPES
ncbi:ATP-dependent zinc protease [Minwuia sp.]|uniref:ATP-dependent zinc protease family protein n=1 Tax=Minwuia sp. TaxID=2493630 RepID=UPI003A92AF71